MKRLLAIAAAALVALGAAAVLVVSQARSDGGPYTVRAIFDDASYAVTGENVRIAGANVGTITALGVTKSERAAVTLTINDSRFAPFYANAQCTIRPQSLIGEEYVDCTPGTTHARRLARIRRGPGAGDYYLPVTRTSSPIDTDIVQDISTEPVRESLSVILGELGTGLAARGSDLNAVIHRANPALGNTDRVLRILAAQRRTLAALATSSAKVLAPLAAERRQIAGFVKNANTTAVASARRAADISRTFHEFPRFLAELRPLMTDLGEFSDQGTPVMRELGSSAAPLGREFTELTPFARSARTALLDLGRATHEATPDLVASKPLAQRLLAVGRPGEASFKSLDTLLESLNSSGGIEQLMNVLYEGVSSANGFNQLGHYVRAEPVTGECTNYALSPIPGCQSYFTRGHGSASAARRDTTAAASPASRAIVSSALKSVSGATSASSVTGLLGYLMGGSSR